MRLHRFYFNKDITDEVVVEDENIVHQLLKVFRLKVGDEIILFDGKGNEFVMTVISFDKVSVTLERGERQEVESVVSQKELNIFQSLIKKDNFEFVVQKCTEIGADSFHPVITERSEKKDLNILRLKKIAIEAVEQSGRSTVPEIFEIISLEEVLKQVEGKKYYFDFDGEDIQDVSFEDNINIFIGPEGGFSDSDIAMFRESGAVSLKLGNNVLRAETAAIVACALIKIGK